jgi:hypothetical protein
MEEREEALVVDLAEGWPHVTVREERDRVRGLDRGGATQREWGSGGR